MLLKECVVKKKTRKKPFYKSHWENESESGLSSQFMISMVLVLIVSPSSIGDESKLF